jgi:hypothetical protein
MKKSELDKKYQAARQWIKDKEKKGNKKTTTKASTTLDKKYQAAKQYLSAREIGLDTFETDINKLNKSINTATSGWQTQETMKNTLSSIRSMSDRLDKYQEYRTQYGNDKLPDLSELQKSYKSAIDNWDALAKSYSGYKDAKTYSKETETLKKFANMSSSEVKSHLDVLKAHLETAEGYENAIGMTGAGNLDKLKKLESQYAGFLKEIGYKDIDSLRNRVAYTTISGDNLTWDSLYKQKAEQEKRNEILKKVKSDINFSKFVNSGSNAKNPTIKETTGLGAKDVVNKLEYANKYKIEMELGALNGATSFPVNIYYTQANDDERLIYNYYLGQELEGKAKKGTAQKYLDSIEDLLEERWNNKVIQGMTNVTEEYPTLGSAISIGTNIASGAEQIRNYIDYAKTGELKRNASADVTNAIRGTVSNKVDWEIGNWDAFDFVYNTAMSGADSLINASVFGTGMGVSLGLSAAAQGTNDALSRGLDNKSAFMSGLASGVFEGLFESVSIGKFNSLKEAPVSGIKDVIKNVGKSMLVNATEETLTELANLTYDYFANADLSQFETQVRAYVNSGLSEADARRKVAVEQGLQVGEAGLSGALMGFGFGAIGSRVGYKQSKDIGQNIRDNNQIADVFDLASNPEISSAYDTYTRYAQKGINAENATDAQVGRLWQEARNDTEGKKIVTPNAYEKLGEMARTPEAKIEAIINDAIASDINKRSKKTKKALGKDTDIEAKRKEAADKAAERLTELGETKNVEEIANIIAKKSVGEDISAEEVKALRESEYGARVYDENDKGISEFVKGMDNVESRIFTQTYDGNTDIEAFANSFNLVSEYAKHPESFTVEDAVKNKGVLSEDNAKYIYVQLKTNEELKATKKNSELMARARKGERGIIDDSVINYGEKHIPGTVHWNSLNERQRQAVIFAKGLYEALGSNLAFVGKNKKFNGAYNVTKDITFIDVFAGRDYRTWTGTDTIISTISHEITHEMKVKTPEAHKILTDLAFRALEKSTGLTKSELIATEVEKLKNKGESHTDEDAIDEIVARACEDMLANSKEAKAMLKELSPAEQKTLVEKIQDIIQKIIDWIDEFLSSYKNQATSEEAKALREMKEEFEAMSAMWDKALREMQKFNKEVANGEVSNDTTSETESLNEMFADVSEAVGTDGKTLFQYRAMEEDEAIYRDMLDKYKDIIGITDNQIDELFNTIDMALDIIKSNLEELDYAWDADIDDRAFHPIKPNSDKLYKVSLDFSTLCRKRMLQQTIQTTLQEALNKNLSKEESIAIRDELMKIQEEGKKIEIACSLCYVESARMKSPVQINKFLADKESVLREFFASRDSSTKEKVEEAETKARESLAKNNPKGLKGKNNATLDALTAPKNAMYKRDADFIRDEGKKVKAEYKLSKSEQAELDAALNMSAVDFTSAEGLENLAKKHPDIFDAYTSFIRNATHSKGLESDVWWRAGDSDSIGDNLIAQMNEENGLRSQSWSDFQVIHLLDYIAATIELSTKGAKRQSYTKVPDYVKLLGNTGDMINMSLIPERVFEGKLSYDGVEGMAYDIAKQLRDEYHGTVGTICIGINNEQISMLLEDATIDMVIPYHHSSMSKAVRKLMHIPAWESYQSYQSEKNLSDAEAKAQAKTYGVELKTDDKMYHKAPNFSEWFDLAEARRFEERENMKAKRGNPSNKEAYKKYGVMYGGYMAMQNAANTYLKLCAERGVSPKFSNDKADFTQDANYWKLLIDRKMVDNITGEIIEQKAIKPIFKEDSVLEILNDELARYPQVKADQEYATRKVTEKFLSGDMKMDKSTRDAIKKPIDNITEVNILESAKEDKMMHQDREQEYLELAKDPVKNEAKLMEMVDAKAVESGVDTDSNGKPIALYHGTSDFGFTTVDTEYSDDKLTFWATSELAVAKSYNGHGLGFKPHEGVRQIGNPTEIVKNPRLDVQKDSATKIVETAAEVFPEYKDATVLTDKQKLKEAKKDIASAYKTAKKLMKSKELTEADAELVRSFIDAVNEGTCEALTEACDVYEKVDAQRADSWFDDDVSPYEERFQILTEKMEEIYEVVRPDYVLVDGDAVYTSHIVARYNAETGNGGVYKFYYKAEKPYVIDCKGVNWNQIETPAEISPTGERMNTRQVAKWAFENGYDSVKYENAVDMGSKKVGAVSATVWAFMNPKEQLKSADPVTYDDDGNVIPLSERFNKKNDDIRYQDREEDIYDIMGERDTAIKRAEKLSEDVSRLKELLKLERRITKGKLYNESSVSGVANFLKNKFGSKINKIELMKALKDVYTYMASADENNLEADAIYSKCEEVARSIFESIEPVMDDYTKKILSDVRNTRVSLTEEQKAEVINRYGNNWPRYFIGSSTVANDGAPLSSVWADWAEQYPDKFSKDINDADMGIELLEAVQNMKDSSEVVDKYLEEERVSQIATEIYNAYWNIPPVKTTADKYSEKIKAIRAEHRKAIKEVRESQKLADDIHYAQKMREQKKKLQKQTYARIKDARAKAKQQGKEIGLRRLDTFKENAEKKTRIQRITSNAISLRKSLEKNSKDDHIHELLKVPVMKLLNAIDFSSKQLIKKGVPTQKDISLRSAFSSISDMLSKAKEGVAGLEDLYGHDLAEQMKLLSDAAERLVGDNAYVINAMSLEELKALDKLVRYMKSTVNRFNKFHVAQHNAGVEALGIETAHEVDNAKKIFKDHKNHFEKLKTKLYWNNLTPYYAFKNLGKGAMKILKALMDGQDKVAFLAKEIIDFTKKLYTEKEYKKWSETFFDFKFEQPDGSTREFTMNVPQIMSLYCVSKQDDAKRHILHGNQVGNDEELGMGRGITIVETKKTRGELKNILLTESDLNKIISKLDEVDRAKEVADALQNYMSTRGAELGNEISMARWGINSFGIEDYFPIKVSDAPSEGETPGVNTASLVALLNMSFTHARNHFAPQSIEIGDVFDVFANHMSSMIQYNAMALPVLDMFKWMNVKTKDDFGNEISVKTSIEDTFGKHAYQYLRKLLADVNGSSKSDTTDNIGVKFFKNAKVAKVAANIRVALLQPTSYIRAGAVIDNKYLLRALAHKPKIAKSKEKSGMVLWKSLGYYETDVTRPLTDKIKHATNAKDKIVDWSLKGAEVADSITLGYLWNACELEIRDTRKDLEVGSPEFYDAIAMRLRDVIYRTQVVDSQLTRSQMMRSKSGWDKMLTTFASESTLSFNLVTDVFVSYQLDSRRYGKEVAKQKNAKYMRKAITAYVITNVVTSAIATMFDAFRDYDEEDKDEEYILKLMLENMATNTSFINKIPYINTIVSFATGFTPSRVETDWMKSATEAIKETTKFIAGEGSSERLIKNLLKSASDATGVAGYNLYRDIRAFIELFN